MRLVLTAAGTRQPFATIVAGSLPGSVACNRLTIQRISGANIYIGLPRPLGTGDLVSSNVRDIVLNAANSNDTIGPESAGRNTVYLPAIFWDSDTSGAEIDISPITV